MTHRPEKFDVVVSAVVRSGPRVLLAQPADHDYWFLPGCPVNPGESARATLHHDVLEALGLQASVADLVAVVENAYELAGVTHHEINLAFEARVSTARVGQDRQGNRYRWFDIEECDDLDIRPPSLARVVRYGPDAQRLPLHSDGLPLP